MASMTAEEERFIEEWVKPFYLEILHGNFLALEGSERDEFIQTCKRACSTAGAAILHALLADDDVSWREHISGAWIVGIQRNHDFTNRVGALLLESRYCYSGQGHVFALAALGTDDAKQYLMDYLDRYLVNEDDWYDQAWALAAIAWLDQAQGTSNKQRYMERWTRFVANKPNWDLEAFSRVMEFCDELFWE